MNKHLLYTFFLFAIFLVQLQVMAESSLIKEKTKPSNHVEMFSIGIEHFENGSFSNAIHIWNSLYQNYKQQENFFQQARLAFYLSEAHQRIGQTWLAINYLVEAQDSLSQIDESEDKLQLKF